MQPRDGEADLNAMEEFILKMKPEPPQPPTLSAAHGSDIRITWLNPEGPAAFREVSVLMRPSDTKRHCASSSEWWRVDGRTKCLMLEGWMTLPPSPPEVVVSGLEKDVAYEAMLDVLTVRGFQLQSEPSQPLCIGRAGTPEPPALEALGPGSLRVRWTIPLAHPPVERVLLFMRRRAFDAAVTSQAQEMMMTTEDDETFEGEHGEQDGDLEWALVDNQTATLMDAGFAGGQTCPATPSEIVVTELECGSYVAKIACLNEHGWSEQSLPSASVLISPC